jgi:hypothetical protein
VSLAEVEADAGADAGVRTYTLVCLVALLVVTLVLIDEAGPWVLLPVVIGGLGLVGRWRSAVPMFLLTVGFVVLAVAQGGDPFFFVERLLRIVALGRAGPGHRGPSFGSENTLFGHFLICAAVLAYAAGQYRLLALTRNAFPLDPRSSPNRKRPDTAARRRPESLCRSAKLVTSAEVGTMLLTLPVWIALGGAVLLWLAVVPNPLDTPREVWRAVLLIWVVGIGLAVMAGALGYLGMTRATPAEARTFLQDVLWRETAREQDRLNRWLVWARLRWQRRKETKR